MSSNSPGEEYKVLLYIANIIDESGFASIDLDRAEKILGIRKDKIANILKKLEKNRFLEVIRLGGDFYETSVENIIRAIDLFLNRKMGENPSVDELLLIHKNLGTRNALINVINSMLPKGKNTNQEGYRLALNELLRETISRDSYANILRIKLQANINKFVDDIMTGIEWIKNPIYRNPLLIKLYNDIIINALVGVEYYTLLIAPIARRAIKRIDPQKTVFKDAFSDLNIPVRKLYIAEVSSLKIALNNYNNRIHLVKDILNSNITSDELKPLIFQLYTSLLIEKLSLENYLKILEKVLEVK